jgi:hypothetical protein
LRVKGNEEDGGGGHFCCLLAQKSKRKDAMRALDSVAANVAPGSLTTASPHPPPLQPPPPGHCTASAVSFQHEILMRISCTTFVGVSIRRTELFLFLCHALPALRAVDPNLTISTVERKRRQSRSTHW